MGTFRDISDFHKKVDMKNVLQDWFDDDGDLIAYKDDEVTRIQIETPDFYTSASKAFNRGRNMPPRLQRPIPHREAPLS